MTLEAVTAALARPDLDPMARRLGMLLVERDESGALTRPSHFYLALAQADGRKDRVIEGKGLHVYPGMIDSGTNLGLSEISAIRESVDTGELGVFNPQLRAEVAVNPASERRVANANQIAPKMATGIPRQVPNRLA